ncbi:hypothetical protein BDY17DRAFT_251487 [Neohortaea acidophila]|uniref:Zn(2)-C6 fungal-type domain-containing protein n=1 Tax=Neohortaea acidophila TaxID=245834 RepID=A0A6A6PSB1_9PEZI|nr:uncharacterized protein BDY17DRAFT_251487 [Neohortaea acidophila]KAF2482554.1 hypothetical protein BDY17DRAFT_251487 [Neohortaea acidophila]
MSTTRAADNDLAGRWHAKRRKLRKGTHSCWACKRRKEKCVYEAHVRPDTCINCQRRGAECISQEFDMDDTDRRGATLVSSEYNNDPKSTASTSSVVVENTNHHSSLRQEATLGEKNARLGAHPSFPSLPTVSIPENASTGVNKFSQLNRALWEALPSRKDREIIVTASDRVFSVFVGSLTISHERMREGNPVSPESLLHPPQLPTHPVLTARYMLHLASLLHHLRPDTNPGMKQLSEPPRVIMARIFDAATRLVTIQDRLLASVEGVECAMLESMHKANLGEFRPSWKANRRAMLLAQSLGLHRSKYRTMPNQLDPDSKAEPRLMWFRIVYYDRQLSLLLGLPQGSTDRSMATEAALASDTPSGRLERMQCVLTGKILENVESEERAIDFALTQSLDKELQKAAAGVPSRWWLTPNLEDSSHDALALFLDDRRLSTQMSHFNLLNKLHLPYMLLSSTEYEYQYSKIACVNASREVLSRFVALRRFSQITFTCRIADFMALMAAMTLLLAHLDSHRRPSQADNLLAHSYLSDRAMIEQARDNMEEANRLTADPLSARGAEVLARLLAIEAEAASGHTVRAESVRVQTADAQSSQQEKGEETVATSSAYIPYFGIIMFPREAMNRIGQQSGDPLHDPAPPDSAEPGHTEVFQHQRIHQPSSSAPVIYPGDSKSIVDPAVLVPHNGGCERPESVRVTATRKLR